MFFCFLSFLKAANFCLKETEASICTLPDATEIKTMEEFYAKFSKNEENQIQFSTSKTVSIDSTKLDNSSISFIGASSEHISLDFSKLKTNFVSFDNLIIENTANSQFITNEIKMKNSTFKQNFEIFSKKLFIDVFTLATVGKQTTDNITLDISTYKSIPQLVNVTAKSVKITGKGIKNDISLDIDNVRIHSVAYDVVIYSKLWNFTLESYGEVSVNSVSNFVGNDDWKIYCFEGSSMKIERVFKGKLFLNGGTLKSNVTFPYVFAKSGVLSCEEGWIHFLENCDVNISAKFKANYVKISTNATIRSNFPRIYAKTLYLDHVSNNTGHTFLMPELVSDKMIIDHSTINDQMSSMHYVIMYDDVFPEEPIKIDYALQVELEYVGKKLPSDEYAAKYLSTPREMLSIFTDYRVNLSTSGIPGMTRDDAIIKLYFKNETNGFICCLLFTDLPSSVYPTYCYGDNCPDNEVSLKDEQLPAFVKLAKNTTKSLALHLMKNPEENVVIDLSGTNLPVSFYGEETRCSVLFGNDVKSVFFENITFSTTQEHVALDVLNLSTSVVIENGIDMSNIKNVYASLDILAKNNFSTAKSCLSQISSGAVNVVYTKNGFVINSCDVPYMENFFIQPPSSYELTMSIEEGNEEIHCLPVKSTNSCLVRIRSDFPDCSAVRFDGQLLCLYIFEYSGPNIPLSIKPSYFVLDFNEKLSFVLHSVFLTDEQRFSCSNNNLTITYLTLSGSFVLYSQNSRSIKAINLIDEGSKGIVNGLEIVNAKEIKETSNITFTNCQLNNVKTSFDVTYKPTSKHSFMNLSKSNASFIVDVNAKFEDNVTSELYFNSVELIRSEESNISKIEANIEPKEFESNGYKVSCSTLFDGNSLFARCTTKHPYNPPIIIDIANVFFLSLLCSIIGLFVVGCLIQNLLCSKETTENEYQQVAQNENNNEDNQV